MLKAIKDCEKRFGSDYLTPELKLTLELAAIFHEADDRKYFPEEGYKNATEMIQKALLNCDQLKVLKNHSKIVKEAIMMIDFCSASKNGNNIPK